MAKFVPDIKSNRWVVIAPTRISRPHDNPSFPDTPVIASHEVAKQSSNGTEQIAASPSAPRNDNKCPFCPGNETLNKTVFSVGNVRVIANKYPITDFHEVIIHSPDHEKDIDELPTEQVELILNVYRQRYNFYKNNGTVMIFNNHDIHAGASLAHPHSQLVVVPKQINLDTMSREPVQNEVIRTKHFVAYCPDFSQWPYEIWIAPLCHAELVSASLANASDSNKLRDPDIRQDDTTGVNFGQITDEEISDLAPLLQKILKVVVNRFRDSGRGTDSIGVNQNDKGVIARNEMTKQSSDDEDIPYNFYIYHGADWYLRIIPRLIHRAGFELGTGLSVNIVDPVKAAEEYKKGIVSS